MQSIALAPKANSTTIWSGSEIHRECDALIVSAHLQNRNSLLRLLEGLSTNTFLAAMIEQAQEVLSSHSVDIIFCDDSLPDGSYRQLLEPPIASGKSGDFVVTFGAMEWDEYLEAIHLGATEVLAYPLQSVDVELAILRAGRDRDRQRLYAAACSDNRQ